jgi:hypothetical protein
MMARLCRWIDKRFSVADLTALVRDTRTAPVIGTGAIWWSAWTLFATGLKSLNALEGQMRPGHRLERLVGRRKPSVDRVGDVYCLVDPGGQREILWRILTGLKRGKNLPQRWPLRFAAIDGHEFFSLTQALLPRVLDAHADGQRRAGPGGVSPRGLLSAFEPEASRAARRGAPGRRRGRAAGGRQAP